MEFVIESTALEGDVPMRAKLAYQAAESSS